VQEIEGRISNAAFRAAQQTLDTSKSATDNDEIDAYGLKKHANRSAYSGVHRCNVTERSPAACLLGPGLGLGCPPNTARPPLP
jgi:hypothetical protein